MEETNGKTSSAQICDLLFPSLLCVSKFRILSARSHSRNRFISVLEILVIRLTRWRRRQLILADSTDLNVPPRRLVREQQQRTFHLVAGHLILPEPMGLPSSEVTR